MLSSLLHTIRIEMRNSSVIIAKQPFHSLKVEFNLGIQIRPNIILTF